MHWKISVIFVLIGIFILNVQCKEKTKSKLEEQSSDETNVSSEEKDEKNAMEHRMPSEDRIIGGEEVKKGEE